MKLLRVWACWMRSAVVTEAAGATDSAPAGHAVPIRATAPALSPGQRAWRRFKRNRVGVVSLRIVAVLLLLSIAAPLISNEHPLLARYEGRLYVPILSNPPETVFGGDFDTGTDWLDPLIQRRFAEPGNWALFTLNHFSGATINFSTKKAHPAPPSAENWLGTDDRGRDVLARLLYGFGIGMAFAIGLTCLTTVVGLLVGAVQGYFGGWVDLGLQRFTEVWNALPQLYMLIILAAIFTPTILLLMFIFTLFSWITLADYVRAEFLRNRGLEFVKGARDGFVERAHHVAPHLAQLAHAGHHFSAVSPQRGLAAADCARLPGPRRAGLGALAGRPAEPGQEQPRRLVAVAADDRIAGDDAAVADLCR